MTARDILIRAKEAGVVFSARGDEITAKGPRDAIDQLVPDLRAHKAELLRQLMTTVEVEIHNKAACDMHVPTERVASFMDEATRRGLIVRYRVAGHATVSTVMPGPGQTAEQLRESLRVELGDRLEAVL